VLHRGHHHAVRGTVATQLVGDHHPRHVPQSLQQLTKEPLRGPGVTTGGDQNVQDIPVLVDRPPQVLPGTVDREEHLVQMPVGLEYRVLGLTCGFAVLGSIMLRFGTRW
jgi:hypothetical protein